MLCPWLLLLLEWSSTSMAWQGCCGRGCKTKWPKTHFSNWFNRLDWNPGKLCISTVFHVVQACAKRKKMFVAFIGFLMCSLMKSGFGIAATLSFAEPSCNYSLSLSLTYIFGHRHSILWQKILTGSRLLH